jgi:hypothetical protein
MPCQNNGEINQEKYKHKCGVRQLLIWRKQWGLKVFREYMHKHREKLNWKLIRDFEDQWVKGNRGNKGEWK